MSRKEPLQIFPILLPLRIGVGRIRKEIFWKQVEVTYRLNLILGKANRRGSMRLLFLHLIAQIEAILE